MKPQEAPTHRSSPLIHIPSGLRNLVVAIITHMPIPADSLFSDNHCQHVFFLFLTYQSSLPVHKPYCLCNIVTTHMLIPANCLFIDPHF
ncbi:hypothetical protein J6590_074977 [Homalodisca vitripennis]|nr:hypothetical protein J6590_074977 [Homalodisca vitripennis]